MPDALPTQSFADVLKEIRAIGERPGRVRAPSREHFRIARDPAWTEEERVAIYRAMLRVTRGDTAVRRLIQQRVDNLTIPPVPRPTARGPWWTASPAERFWIEITDRDEIGSDLSGYQRDAGHSCTQAYILARYIQTDDVALHYDLRRHSIVGRSVVAEPCVETTGSWSVQLRGCVEVSPPIDLARICRKSKAVRLRLDAITKRHRPPYYFPFVVQRGGLTIRQTYLAKIPAAVVALFPEFSELVKV